jgi:hypothetical protein
VSGPRYLGAARNVRIVWINGAPGNGPLCVWAFVRSRRGGGTFIRTEPLHA